MAASIPALFKASPLLKPIRFFVEYDRKDLRPDLMAGLTSAVVLLPQAIAFALIAELPPAMGIYTAIVAAVIGGLWGSSNQILTGPTNALSLLVLSALLAANNAPGSSNWIIAAGMMAVMVGVFQTALGLAGLGVLVNFVSHSVVVGFAAGAGLLIVIKQAVNLLGLRLASRTVPGTLRGVATHITDTHFPTALLGLVTILAMLLVLKLRPRLPASLLGIVVGTLGVFIFGLREQGVEVLGTLPANLPPAVPLPLLDLDMLSQLSVGALAVAAIGLVQTTAISRSIATQTGQRLDTNQEFVGQGLANIASGVLSGYPCSASFGLSAINYKSGAKSALSGIFAAFFVLCSLFVLAPAAAYLPVSALAGVLMVTAFRIIDFAEIKRIYTGARGDSVILTTTLLGTLFLNVEFAVLTGILLSFAFYILKTSFPRVEPVLPDVNFRHFRPQGDSPSCPQLGIVEIRGDLYFGAVNHIEEAIVEYHARNSGQRYLLLRMKGVNHCDFSGIHALEGIVRSYRDSGGDVFLTRVQRPLLRLMLRTGFHNFLGRDHFLASDKTIDHLFYRVIDPAICIYECPVRAFRECQNLPKREFALEEAAPHTNLPGAQIVEIDSRELWKRLCRGSPATTVIDVREPREFQSGHIAQAKLLPLPELLKSPPDLPVDQPMVLVCRGGRRSTRAAGSLLARGFRDVSVLHGGMLAWEAAQLLEAVEEKGVLDSTMRLHTH